MKFFLFLVLSHMILCQKFITKQTKNGNIRGEVLNHHARYLGIPFAEPPINHLRFTSPQKKKRWQNTLDTFNYSRACPQQWRASNPISEDCLYLNVHTPQTTNTTTQPLLPVMVYIYGGNLDSGSTIYYQGDNFFEDEKLKTRGTSVYVALNYRVGSFGFLKYGNDPNILTGYMGIEDQVMALQWINENIGDFGGDKNRVTIFGESAGALSVCALLAEPKANDLFHKAIIQSVPNCDSHLASDANANGEKFLKKLNCADTTCMMRTKMEDIVKAQVGWRSAWRPVYTEKKLDRMILDGEYRKIPEMIIGITKQEASAFICPIAEGFNLTDSTLGALIQKQYGTLVGLLGLIYDFDSYPSNLAALIDILTDIGFACPTRRIADRFARDGIKVYMYYFVLQPDSTTKCLGATHTAELPYLFNPSYIEYDPFYNRTNYTYSARDLDFSYRIRDYWLNFSRSSYIGEGWELYSASKNNYLKLDWVNSKGTDFRRDQCDKLDVALRYRDDKLFGYGFLILVLLLGSCCFFYSVPTICIIYLCKRFSPKKGDKSDNYNSFEE